MASHTCAPQICTVGDVVSMPPKTSFSEPTLFRKKRGAKKKAKWMCDLCGKGFLHKGRYLLHKWAFVWLGSFTSFSHLVLGDHGNYSILQGGFPFLVSLFLVLDSHGNFLFFHYELKLFCLLSDQRNGLSMILFFFFSRVMRGGICKSFFTHFLSWVIRGMVFQWSSSFFHKQTKKGYSSFLSRCSHS